MLKMLVLYRRLLFGALTGMAVYVAIVVAGVWLTDLSLFETYVLLRPFCPWRCRPCSAAAA